MDREKANELWEQRGCREGHDLEDWFDAEAMVMEARRDASHMSRIEQIQIVQSDRLARLEIPSPRRQYQEIARVHPRVFLRFASQGVR